MGQYHVTGYPLDNFDVGESEALLTLFTREAGKISVAVKGTKKVVSTLRPALSPLQEGHYFITERRTSDLVTEWEPVKTYYELKSSGKKLAVAGYMTRMIMKLAPGREPDEALYNLLENIYYLLLENTKHDIIKSLLEWGMLRVMGIAPPFELCAGCGKKDGSGGIWWNIPDGNVFCPVCGDMDRHRSVRLCLEAKKYGNNIDILGGIITESQPEDVKKSGEMEGMLKELEGYRAEDREAFSRALKRFCIYHLNEDVDKWHIDI